MTIVASDVFDLGMLPAGRCQVAMLRCEELARDEGVDAVADRAKIVAAKAGEQFKLEQRWRAQRGKGAKRETASALDKRADALLMHTERHLKSLIEGLNAGVGVAAGEAAQRLLPALFTSAASRITSLSYEEQYAAMLHLVEQAQDAKKQADVQAAGIKEGVDALGALLEDYRVAMQREGRELVWRDVTGGQQQLHEQVCELWALALAQTYGDSADHKRRRQAILAPIKEQLDLVRAKRRAKAEPTDIDPSTQDELPIYPDDQG